MIKWLPLLLMLSSCANAQGIIRVGLGGTGGGSGGGLSGSSAIEVAFDCRSFGQTVSSDETTTGTLNIKYATPIMCWATDTTVSSVAVNDTGWVPEVWFEWDWDDTSLGSVTRGGQTVDLGESIGLVAAHAFKPDTYSETCNGGTNSLHTVTLTVYSLVAGARESDSATMTVCVEDPATTWPTPIAYCDDPDCSNDSFTNVVHPGSPTHGGNGTALNTILAQCASSSNRILVEGGVTFSTGSTGIAVGANSCLVESYGTGNAKLQFTSTSSSSSAVNASSCAGYRFNDVTFAGSGSAPRIFTAPTGGGCLAVIDSDVSSVSGERFSAAGINTADPPSTELYFIKFNYTEHNSGLAQFYFWNNYTAFIGGEISGITGNVGEHNIRMAQWEYFVSDGMLFDDQDDGHEIIALRHQCDGTTSCPSYADTQYAAITRSEFNQEACTGCPQSGGTNAVQFLASGSGSNEQTKAYDGDILRNIFKKDASDNKPKYATVFNSTTSGGEAKRFRYIQNLVDSAQFAGSGNALLDVEGGPTPADIAFLGNVIWGGTTVETFLVSDFSGTGFTGKNNVCAETGSGSCNQFSGQTESADNQSETTDPFDAVVGSPTSGDAFAWADFAITSSNTAIKGQGVISAYPTDVFGESVPQSGDYDAGIDDE